MKYKGNTRNLSSIKKPSEKRYFAEERWKKNKEKRISKLSDKQKLTIARLKQIPDNLKISIG